MGTRVYQPNFTGGIIGPDMYARSDTSKYVVGVKRADNALIRLQGGLANRPGFRLASGYQTAGASSSQWLMPVQISAELGYLLEFGESKCRVISEGAYVIDTNTTPAGVADISLADPAVIECDSSGEAAVFSVGDLVYLEDPNGDHVLDTQVLEVTGVTNEFVSFKVFDNTTLDTSTGGTSVWGAIGSGATLSRIYDFDHPYTLSDLPFVRFAQDGPTLYLAHPSYPVKTITVADADDWTVADFTYEPSIDPPVEPGTNPITITDATQANPVVITSAGHGLTDGTTIYIESVGGMTELNDEYYRVSNATTDTFELQSTTGEDVDGTGYTPYTSGGTATTFAAYEVTDESGTIYRYKISTLHIDTLEESLPSEAIEIESDASLTDINVIWPAVADAGFYNIYREVPGGYAYVGTSTNTIFTDINIEPDSSITPKTSRNPFDSADNYPAVVSFVEQRLALANTNNDPQLIEMSATGSYSNFTRSYPADSDDSLRFRLRTRSLNDVRALVPGRALTMFTAAAEWIVTGNDNEGVLTPTSIVPRPESYWGAYDIEPLTVGEYAFFAEPSGNVIRSFLLTLNPNATESTRDLTILVRHLFEDRFITSWCYAQAPDRMIWVTLDDGSLLSMCFMAEHDIWGWTTHTLGGDGVRVYQVATVREGDRDAVYAVIGRTLGGEEVVMTERLDERVDDPIEDAYYLDSGLTYVGTSTSQISGLFHLRGQTVAALVDGNVVEDLTVGDNGAVSFGDIEGEVIHVGLPYETIIETLDVDFEAEALGSMQGRFKAVSEVAVNVKRTRGISAGIDDATLDEIKEWNASYVGGTIPLFTGTRNISVSGDWVRNASVVLKQTYPLPMTLLGVAPEWEIGE